MTRDLLIPAERFYWALLDGSKIVGSPHKREEALSYLFEAQIPEQLEDVHAVFVDAGHRRFVACGISKRILASEVSADCVTACPESVPGFLGAALDPRAFNVLTGVFTSPAVL